MSQRPDFILVEDQAEYQAMLPVLKAADVIGYDTEFVAEDCYRPDLCLVQLSTRDSIFVVDPKAVDMDAAWNLLVDGDRQVIVHAGREEILFVQKATGKSMPRLFDVQIAMGLLGGEYPASYGKLLMRILDINVAKGETRTDWRKRPLTREQLNYAALDVLHLPELYDVLKGELTEKNRLAWLEDEIQARQIALRHFTEQESWVRISGVQSLRSKQLGIVRELWLWREERAKSKNMPARRVLRDDLIVELAKRGLTDERRIAQIRGMHHSGFQRFLPDIASAVDRGLEATVPEAPWAKRSRRTKPPALLQQFLAAAMSYQCRSHRIAPSIVGTTDDVGRLAGYWIDGKTLDEEHDDFPNLLRGWRREFVGDPLRDIFLGRRALRVQDPSNEMPLALCDIDAQE